MCIGYPPFFAGFASFAIFDFFWRHRIAIFHFQLRKMAFGRLFSGSPRIRLAAQLSLSSLVPALPIIYWYQHAQRERAEREHDVRTKLRCDESSVHRVGLFARGLDAVGHDRSLVKYYLTSNSRNLRLKNTVGADGGRPAGREVPARRCHPLRPTMRDVRERPVRGIGLHTRQVSTVRRRRRHAKCRKWELRALR